MVAIGGALACLYISKQEDSNSVGVVLVAVGLSLVVAFALGAWNGVLVARFGVQPIIATLVLMVAGRGVAQLITGARSSRSTAPPQADRRRLPADAAVLDPDRRRGVRSDGHARAAFRAQPPAGDASVADAGVEVHA